MSNHTIEVLRTGDLRRGSYAQPYYEAVGPDGTKFTNSSKAEITRVIKARYGRSTVVTVRDAR